MKLFPVPFYTIEHFPIGSMGLVYLPSFAIDLGRQM